MPRTSRNKVVFSVDGEEWVAVFKHEHANGKPLVEHEGKMTRKLTHVTTCLLGKIGSVGLSAGEAKCSVRDYYDWRKGVKLSFERALEVRGIVRQGPDRRYGAFMREFFKEMKNR